MKPRFSTFDMLAPYPIPTASRWWLIPLLFVFVALVARGADADTFWFDEVGSLYYAGGFVDEGPRTLADVIASQVSEDLEDETNPPGYYVLLHLWVSVFGTSEFAVRLLSLMAGVLAVTLVYRVGQEVASVELGLAAAILLGTCAFYLYYMHEARSYALYSLFVALSLWAYTYLINHKYPPPWMYGLLGLGIVGLLYIHYLSTMFLLAAALYHLLFVPKNTRWWRITLTVVIAGLLFVPWFQLALRSFGNISGNESREAFALPFDQLFIELFTQFGNQSPLIVGALLLAAIPRGNRLLWFLLAGTLLFTALANAQVRFISDAHYLMAAFPLLALVAAQGIMRFGVGGVLILVLWAFAGVWLTLRPPPVQPGEWHLTLGWDALAQMVGDPIQVDDKVIFHVPDPDPSWIHRRGANYYLRDLTATLSLVESYTTVPPEKHTDNLRNYIGPPARFWMVQDTAAPPSVQGIIERDRLFTREGVAYCGTEHQVETIRARLYADMPQLENIPAFTEDLRVGMVPWPPSEIGVNKHEFMLATSADTDTTPYQILTQVRDEGGNVIDEYPAPFPPDARGCVHIVMDKSGWGAGTYEVVTQVQSTATGDIIPLQAEDTHSLSLFSLTIAE